MTRTSPVGRRRHLSRELLRLREATGQTADQAARAVGETPSTITRIERNLWKLPKIPQVAKLLDAYGVTEDAAPERRATLLGYAHQARQRDWWERYPGIGTAYGTYIGLEHEAVMVRQFAPVHIPGLFRTRDYSHALHAGEPGGHADALAEVIAERQRLLTCPDPVRVWALVWEAALHHQPGGADIQAAQLEHLLKVAELQNVTLQVVPFQTALPAAVGFTHLMFRDVIDPSAVCELGSAGGTWIEDPERIPRYTDAFEALLRVALPVTRSAGLIEHLARTLRT